MLDHDSARGSILEVLDRVLDKGIVIDASVRVRLVGIEVVGVDMRVVVASFETYLTHADLIASTGLASPARETAREEALEVGVHDTSTVGDSSTVTWRGTSGPGAPPSDEVGEPTAPDECASSGLAPEVPGSDPPSAAHPPADDALREEET
jgi:hypothetical protein